MSDECKETSLKQLIQGMVPEGAVLLQGTVMSVNPLKIKITNDDKLIIGESITVVPWHLQDYTTTIDIGNGSIDSGTNVGGDHTHDKGMHDEHTSGDGGHTHGGGTHSHKLSTFNINGATMTVHNSLQIGDNVHVLSIQNGKKYFVLDRV